MIRLPWRSHTHIDLHTRIGADRWEHLFDRVAEAAERLDEEVSVAGSIADDPNAHIEVVAFGLRRAAVDALTDRVTGAVGAAHIVRVRRRCRC